MLEYTYSKCSIGRKLNILLSRLSLSKQYEYEVKYNLFPVFKEYLPKINHLFKKENITQYYFYIQRKYIIFKDNLDPIFRIRETGDKFYLTLKDKYSVEYEIEITKKEFLFLKDNCSIDSFISKERYCYINPIYKKIKENFDQEQNYPIHVYVDVISELDVSLVEIELISDHHLMMLNFPVSLINVDNLLEKYLVPFIHSDSSSKALSKKIHEIRQLNLE